MKKTILTLVFTALIAFATTDNALAQTKPGDTSYVVATSSTTKIGRDLVYITIWGESPRPRNETRALYFVFEGDHAARTKFIAAFKKAAQERDANEGKKDKPPGNGMANDSKTKFTADEITKMARDAGVSGQIVRAPR